MIPAVLIAAATALQPVPAGAQPEPPCTISLPVMAEQLAERYGEAAAGGGAAIERGVSVLFVNPRTGTWTMVYAEPGAACIVGAGTDWRFAPRGEGL